VVKPDIRAQVVAVSSDGQRFAAASQREVEIFDRDGKSLASFGTAPEQYAFEMRGDDVWTSGNDGNIRHYVRGQLVADRPAHITPVRALVLNGTTLASLAEDSSLVFAKADEQQLVMTPEVCPHPSFGPLDLLTTYICADKIHIYNGRELLADVATDRELMSGQYEPATHRTLVDDQDGLTIFDREKKPIAHLAIPRQRHLGAPAWLDSDHVLLGEEGKAVWKWTISTNALDKVLDVPQLYAQVPIADGLLVGTGDNKVMKIVGGKVVHSTDVHDRVEHLSLSADARWALAQLTNGAVAIINTATGEVTRQLEPAEQSGGDPVFDTTGELILREARNELTIWDRASGDELVFNFRLLDGLMGGRFLPDGRIEVAARSPALLDIPLDARPVASIIREIACRVPLEVKAGRLGPSTPKCD
jgi:WD40 repeat protein